MQTLGNHSRSLALAPGAPVQVFAVAADPDDRTTWLVSAQNATDAVAGGGQAVITLTSDYRSASGVVTQIVTEIGPREEVQLYATRAVTITASTGFVATLDISITATGGGTIPHPPLRHQQAVANIAYVGLSPSNGYAPAGTRWFHIFSDATANNYDLRLMDSAANILWDVANIPGSTVTGPLPLPPGLRLVGKSNAGAHNITTIWMQKGGS